MYEFLLFVIIGILMYLFLNTSNNGFSVGGQGRELGTIDVEPNLMPPSRAESGSNLVDLKVELEREHNQVMMDSDNYNIGDIVEIYTPGALQTIHELFGQTNAEIELPEIELPENLNDNVIGIIEDFRRMNSNEIFRQYQTRPLFDNMIFAEVNFFTRQYTPSLDRDLDAPWRRLTLAYAMNQRLILNSPLTIIPEDLLQQITTELNMLLSPIANVLVPIDRLRVIDSPINILRDVIDPSTKYSCMFNGRCIRNTNHGNYNSKVECEIDCIQKWACASMRFA